MRQYKKAQIMKQTRLLLGTAFWLLVAIIQASGQESIAVKIDAIVEAPVKAGRVAGASVAVVKGNETIVTKGYGFADLELDVPTPPQATYEIGSITKQFTAAAILLLAEQGKLSLADEMTKFLPDYPMQGNHVTIRHLLNHTSGIKGYTELPEFRDFQMLKRPREELVKLFSGRPFDFKPGEEQIYNNSAFFLLGLIIEKVSGKPYAEFIQEQLFDRKIRTIAVSAQSIRITHTDTIPIKTFSCSKGMSTIRGCMPPGRYARARRIWLPGTRPCTAGNY